MQKLSIFICTFSILLWTAGCNPMEALTEGGLFSSDWVLEDLPGVDKGSFMGGLPHLNFNKKDKIITGSDGCNNFNGKYELDKGKLSLGNLAQTQKACPGKSYDTFMDVLTNTEKLEIEDGKLLLKSGKDVLASFVKG
jgi:heat shock protein HslJ